MSEDKEEAIRKRAFEIWEAQGHPEGLDQEHWRQAEAELAEGAEPDELPNPLASGAAAEAIAGTRRKKS